MEDHAAARRHRLPARRRRRRHDHPGGDADRADAAVVFRAAHALHRLGLFPRWREASDRGVSVKILYFAWVRERVGKPEEVIEPPAAITTVGELMAWLAGRGDEYAHAFENRAVIRAAVDRTHVK